MTASSVGAQVGNDVQQRAALSCWGKKYMVDEIPPFCGHRGAEQDGEVDGRTECNHHQHHHHHHDDADDVFGESWSPMVPSSDRDVAEAMDCSSILEGEEEDDHKGADTCSM